VIKCKLLERQKLGDKLTNPDDFFNVISRSDMPKVVNGISKVKRDEECQTFKNNRFVIKKFTITKVHIYPNALKPLG
jgi:hypothetical protein